MKPGDARTDECATGAVKVARLMPAMRLDCFSVARTTSAVSPMKARVGNGGRSASWPWWGRPGGGKSSAFDALGRDLYVRFSFVGSGSIRLSVGGDGAWPGNAMRQPVFESKTATGRNLSKRAAIRRRTA
ncbi:MAG: hypothetical protein JJ992_01340, partial [Planctomycetes bacterium]|nr:hypothetical protein [Planctomycetota bacterium]